MREIHFEGIQAGKNPVIHLAKSQAHQDGPAYWPGVCIVSLGAAAVMRFRSKVTGDSNASALACSAGPSRGSRGIACQFCTDRACIM